MVSSERLVKEPRLFVFSNFKPIFLQKALASSHHISSCTHIWPRKQNISLLEICNLVWLCEQRSRLSTRQPGQLTLAFPPAELWANGPPCPVLGQVVAPQTGRLFQAARSMQATTFLTQLAEAFNALQAWCSLLILHFAETVCKLGNADGFTFPD